MFPSKLIETQKKGLNCYFTETADQYETARMSIFARNRANFIIMEGHLCYYCLFSQTIRLQVHIRDLCREPNHSSQSFTLLWNHRLLDILFNLERGV